MNSEMRLNRECCSIILTLLLIVYSKSTLAIQTDYGTCHKTFGRTPVLLNTTRDQCLQEILDRWYPSREVSDVRITNNSVAWNFWWPNTYIGALHIENICYSPYVWSTPDKACVKYCPLDRPNIENGVCTGPETIQLCAGNPVNISNGNKLQIERPDIQHKGPYPLYFTRSYNSQRSEESIELRQKLLISKTSTDTSSLQWGSHVQPSGYSGMNIGYAANLIGKKFNNVRVAGYKNWTHNYEGLLENFDGIVRINTFKVTERRFLQQVDGSYEPENIHSDSLTRVESDEGILLHWVYQSEDNQFEYYNTKGLLIRRTNLAGLSHYLEYDANNKLLIVKDDTNNQLIFSYDSSNRLFTIVSSQGETVNFTYDLYGNLASFMKQFTSGKQTIRTYHYEDVSHPYALTGITDEAGNRYTTWEYDELGRVITSIHAGEFDKTSFAFEANKTTVTNSLGKQTIYNYSTIAGAKRLDTVEGVASRSCLAANQSYEYYDTGQLKSKTDWKGIKTEFVYNDRGLEVKRTEAIGTSEQRVITTTWHDQFSLPQTVTIDNKVTVFSYDESGQLKNKTVSTL